MGHFRWEHFLHKERIKILHRLQFYLLSEHGSTGGMIFPVDKTRIIVFFESLAHARSRISSYAIHAEILGKTVWM